MCVCFSEINVESLGEHGLGSVIKQMGILYLQ